VRRPARIASRLGHPRTTVRWRLTLLYGGLFLASGAALLAVTYTLVDHASVTNATFRALGISAKTLPGPPRDTPLRKFYQEATSPVGLSNTVARARNLKGPPFPRAIAQLLSTIPGHRVLLTAGSAQRISDLHQLIVESSIALAIMTLISGALGWVVAGRVLRPLRTMTTTTQQISAASLNQRLAMQGPRDELRQLADTIDGLLERMEGAFNAQRRFVANASHELRTPLTATRALLEMVLTDPHATVDTFRSTCEQVLEEGEQQEQLIEALLALAQGQRGIDQPQLIDLESVTRDVVAAHEPAAAEYGVSLHARLDPALVSGERRLVERLVSNLVENALRHNVPAGYVHVRVAAEDGVARLTVDNSGPPIPADQVNRLTQPFQRLVQDRVRHRDGLGLGLSIVAAIADAHHAKLDLRPGRDGGLEVDVRFPLVAYGELEPSVGLGRGPQPAEAQTASAALGRNPQPAEAETASAQAQAAPPPPAAARGPDR
jgi:signal transduction histidine kinase